ncbi:hypothetical protein IP87_09550 [beta proteobacterium AAP121]|nr:hypothetical protein IP80_09095 [beta proteobacterium AAP65]KPF97985.1 hypothetical protein IP87_09550 [beta proteobacterium AAP121]
MTALRLPAQPAGRRPRLPRQVPPNAGRAALRQPRPEHHAPLRPLWWLRRRRRWLLQLQARQSRRSSPAAPRHREVHDTAARPPAQKPLPPAPLTAPADRQPAGKWFDS